VRPEPRKRVRSFVLGLLAGLPRTNCWTIAEHAGDASPDGMQHLLARAVWDADVLLLQHPDPLLRLAQLGVLGRSSAGLEPGLDIGGLQPVGQARLADPEIGSDLLQRQPSPRDGGRRSRHRRGTLWDMAWARSTSFQRHLTAPTDQVSPPRAADPFASVDSVEEKSQPGESDEARLVGPQPGRSCRCRANPSVVAAHRCW
jgi:hypothetical protein